MLPRQFQRARGFTLVEILCLVVILGIASAIIIPQLGSRDDLLVASGARMLMADMIYAQNRAIALQKNHFVQFSGQTYTLQTRDSDTSPLYTITNPVSLENYTTTLGASGSALANVSLDSTNFGGPTGLAFDETGIPYSYDGTTLTELTNAGTIVLKCGAASLTISVEPFTGELNVQ